MGNKTVANAGDVEGFIASIEDEGKRSDCETLIEMMRAVTGEPPVMWGSSMVGFGSYHYRYESGREGDFMLTGFAPRKRALTVYIMAGFKEYEPLLSQLGKHKTGKSCLYIKRLADVDQATLHSLIELSVARMRETYPAS